MRKLSLTIYDPTDADVAAVMHVFASPQRDATRRCVPAIRRTADVEHDDHGTAKVELVLERSPF